MADLIPTENQVHLAAAHVLTHMAVLKLKFTHNHSILSAHALRFRPVDEATKQRMFALFSMGHSAASARHAHETDLRSLAQKMVKTSNEN